MNWRTLVNLGIKAYDEGLYDDAEKCLRAALEKSGSSQLEDQCYGNGLLRLISLLHEQARLAEAEEQCRASINTYEDQHLVGCLNCALLEAELARILRKRGNNRLAESYMIRSLDTRERLLGKEHPDLAADYCKLAECIREQGRLAESGTLLQRAIHLREKNYGRDDIALVPILDALAIVLMKDGELHEARELFERACEIFSNKTGGRHSIADHFTLQQLLLEEEGALEKLRLRLERASRDPGRLHVPKRLARYKKRLEALIKLSIHISSDLETANQSGFLKVTSFTPTVILPAATMLPICRGCASNMSVLLQVDFSELVLADGAPTRGLLQLFRCELCIADFTEENTHEYARWYPDWQSAGDIDAPYAVCMIPWISVPSARAGNFTEIIGDQQFFDKGPDKYASYIEAFADPFFYTQIGGYPPWLEREQHDCDDSPNSPVLCATCLKEMDFLLAIGSESRASPDNVEGYWFIFYCHRTEQCKGLYSPTIIVQSTND